MEHTFEDQPGIDRVVEEPDDEVEVEVEEDEVPQTPGPDVPGYGYGETP